MFNNRFHLAEPGVDPVNNPDQATKPGKTPWTLIFILMGIIMAIGFAIGNINGHGEASSLKPSQTGTVNKYLLEPTLTASPTGQSTGPTPLVAATLFFLHSGGMTQQPSPEASGQAVVTRIVSIPGPVVQKVVTQLVPVEVTVLATRKVTVIVTATPLPTWTQPPTQTPWIIFVTAEPSQTPTPTKTLEPVIPSATPTLEATASETPTGTPSETPTQQ